MNLDEMRALLTDFLSWQEEHDCYAIDALEPYLEYRQSCALIMGDDLSTRAHVEVGVSRPARSTKVGGCDGKHGPLTICGYSDCHLNTYPAYAPPAPQATEQRYWRVDAGVSKGMKLWWAWEVDERGLTFGSLSPPGARDTRAEAEADGRASGLPEWKTEQ